jgi:hypothetical protein
MSKPLNVGESTVTLPVCMPRSMAQALKQLSSRKVSRGAIVRQAIAEFLAKSKGGDIP